MPAIDNELQSGERQQLDTLDQAIPAAPSPAPAGIDPAIPPAFPQGALPQELPSKEEFISPFASADMSYDESKAMWRLWRLGRMATDERNDPALKELYWAAKQDFEELHGANQQQQGNVATEQLPQQSKQQQNNPSDNSGNTEVVALLTEIRDYFKSGNK